MCPCSTSSGIPDTGQETTGTPIAIASIRETGMPSITPLRFGAGRDGRAKTDALAIIASTSCGVRSPSIETSPRSRRRSMSLSSSARSGPSPTMRHEKTAPRSRRSAAAPRSVSNPLIAIKRPTASTIRLPVSGDAEGSRPRSRPQCRTSTFDAASGPTASRMNRRLYSEMAKTRRARRTLTPSKSWLWKMSWAWAVAVNGIPVRREMTNAAVAG